MVWGGGEGLAHIHVGFFKGGKPEVSAGGEDAFKAIRTAIRNRNHWRWRLRIRSRHTSIRKSATPTQPTTTTTTSKRTLPGDVGTLSPPMCRRMVSNLPYKIRLNASSSPSIHFVHRIKFYPPLRLLSPLSAISLISKSLDPDSTQSSFFFFLSNKIPRISFRRRIRDAFFSFSRI